jgi:MoaA/NifB/PqqE/SkfB family radical SAM enzyme
MFCCKSELWLDDAQGKKSNIKYQGFEEALNGKLANEIRDALDSGIKHKNCKKCWEEEASGLPSKRMLDNDRAKEYWGEEFLNDKIVEPVIVELNLGTECNLKCRICGPWSSSRWVKEHYKIFHHDQTPNGFKQYMESMKEYQGDWKDTSPVWNNIERGMPTLKQVDFYGGEPMMVKKNWSLLQKGIDLGYAKEQVLHFNTNGTFFEEAHIEILKHYKKVLISLSIDDIQERFEYERSGGVWSEVSENIQKFYDLDQKFSNIDVCVCITVNNLNIYYIPEVASYLDEIGLHYYVNFLHGPPYYDVRNIRENIKENVVSKYNSVSCTEHTRENLNKVLNFMRSHISTKGHWDDFIKYTKDKDEYRKENFNNTFPEWSKVIYESMETA